MLFYLFLLFTLVPLAELAILIWIGGQTEWWVPIVTVIATGVAGAALARWQGWQVVSRIQKELNAGRMPADAIIDGVLILIAGLLLVTPGVLTDFVGIALLIPPWRSVVKRAAAAWIKRNFEVRVVGTDAEYGPAGNSGKRTRCDQIIDAEVIGTQVEDAEPTERST